MFSFSDPDLKAKCYWTHLLIYFRNSINILFFSADSLHISNFNNILKSELALLLALFLLGMNLSKISIIRQIVSKPRQAILWDATHR